MEEIKAEALTQEEIHKTKYAGELLLIDPIELDGKEVEKLPYDFGFIRPKDLNRIQADIEKKKKRLIQVRETDPDIQIALFAKASNTMVPDLETKMSLPDYMNACRTARDFLCLIQIPEDGT